MPVSINTAALKYRDQQGTYQPINSIKGDNGALNIVAPAYENLTYPVAAGQGCIYNDLYYVAKQDIASQESWTAGHWEQRMIADEVHGMPQDIQINGTSILQDGVANVPLGSNNAVGALKGDRRYGTDIDSNGNIKLYTAGDSGAKAGTGTTQPITPSCEHSAVFYGLSKLAGEDLKNDTVTVGQYPEKSKSAISQMLNAPVTISGTTPVITAKSGIRYICGEVSTLDITAPESGCVDITFTSGSTPTVLTVTSAKSNTTIKWVGDFDPDALEANTQYEINVMDGEWGMAVSWT